MVFQLICPDQTKSLTITRNFEISSALFINRVKIICAHVICQTTPVEVCNPNTCCVRSNFFFLVVGWSHYLLPDESWVQQHQHYLDRSADRPAPLQTPPGKGEDGTATTARKVEIKWGVSSVCFRPVGGKSIEWILILIHLFSVGLLFTIIYHIGLYWRLTQ